MLGIVKGGIWDIGNMDVSFFVGTCRRENMSVYVGSCVQREAGMDVGAEVGGNVDVANKGEGVGMVLALI